MSGIPQRLSLVSQTVAYLKAEIARGQWTRWLPGERQLCDQLQVSRNTLRTALRQLGRDGVIRPEHGLGSRIVHPPEEASGSRRSSTVCLLTPEPLETLRPTHVLWIDELRALLIEHGCRLQVLHGQQFFRARPGAALQRLVQQHQPGCWIVIRSRGGTQAWFDRSGVPCVIAGSVMPGVDLPFVDLDHRALCRHAAGVLLGLGHRRLAFLLEHTRRPGDVASEQGFLDGVRTSGHPDARALVIAHDPTVDSVCSTLRRLLDSPRPPTALFVANPFHYLTLTSRLAQLGRPVPRGMSVLCRDDDSFLSFVVPPPARYRMAPHAFARKLLRPVLEAVEGGHVMTRATSLMPEFVRGESIGPPPA
ncbi:MAG: substrate-binding domain-containing protein [Verrucomicrobia bacterium]|nr:substrate-binding domain-containing protein [Verrucomicrobiota bacterium]